MSRSFLILTLLPLPACFTTFRPDGAWRESWQVESSTCSNRCQESCADIDSRSLYEACVDECVADCEDERTNCARPTAPEPPPPPPATCSSCAPEPPKAGLCQACKVASDCAGTGALCLGVDSTTGYGRCGQKCVVDCDCPESYECRPVTDPATGRYDADLGRQCVPESGKCPECWSDNECSDYKICEAGSCVPGCVDDTSCPSGQRCFEDGRCAVACCEDQDCGEGHVCKEGRCR